MGSTPPVSRMYKRHAFTLEEDDDDMDEDDNQAGVDPTENDMDWQPFETGMMNNHDVDMLEEKSRDAVEIKLRPAVFNPNDEWGLTAYGMKGLDGLFAKGVSLDDIRMDEMEPRNFKRMSPNVLYSFAGTVCICIIYAVYALLRNVSFRN